MASSLDWQRAKGTGSKVLHVGAGFREVSKTSLVGARLASKEVVGCRLAWQAWQRRQ